MGQDRTRQKTVLRIRGELPELSKVVALVVDFAAANALPGAPANAMNLILDELLNNIITHGLEDGKAREIRVALILAGRRFSAEIEDDGIAFDPLNAPGPSLAGGLHDRRLGGVGLHFVRQLTDVIDYKRLKRRNRLRVSIDLTRVRIDGGCHEGGRRECL